ncbi:hypothetical protein [Sulfobacillus harzensis]|uniref:Pseudouridine synthase RsuA/RluA-like domain-containing protein n=1 Tax=Sulfobacillus harzensis TaxID=2729629 RepID=A0A7Y0Q1I8_9FIRM|nr:hypothetical protein [Sulfobacillus harzensis]NMP20881.1 hypothetical protein [Sulfobacillus harzensis]
MVIADKPAGMAVHPQSPEGTGTVVNALLHNNRWLADMETSHAPGVVHVLAPEDRGLVVVAKSEEAHQELTQLKNEKRLIFSVRVRLNSDVEPTPHPDVVVIDHQRYDGLDVYDIDTSIGDTAQLRSSWLHGDAAASMVVYRVHVPMAQKRLDIGLGERIWLPRVDLYTAPP